MKSLVFAACIAASTAFAQEDPFLKGEELKATIERDCSEGCITFNRLEAQELQDALENLIADKQKEAFEAGKRFQAQACRSLI